jgi:protein CpxP
MGTVREAQFSIHQEQSMNTVRKSIAIAVASVALAGGGIAVTSSVAASPGQGFQSVAFGSNDGGKFAERIAKRQAALHDKLALTPAQEASWKTFTDRMQASVPAKAEPAPVADMTAPERADRMVAFLQTAEQRAATRAQAIKEFYSGLSPDQQKVFDSQFQGRHRHHHHRG